MYTNIHISMGTFDHDKKILPELSTIVSVQLVRASSQFEIGHVEPFLFIHYFNRYVTVKEMIISATLIKH